MKQCEALLTHIGERLSGLSYNSTLDDLHGLRDEAYLAGYVERGVDLGKEGAGASVNGLNLTWTAWL